MAGEPAAERSALERWGFARRRNLERSTLGVGPAGKPGNSRLYPCEPAGRCPARPLLACWRSLGPGRLHAGRLLGLVAETGSGLAKSRRADAAQPGAIESIQIPVEPIGP